MGLDQYLTAHKFTSGYDHHGKGEKETQAKILAVLGLESSVIARNGPFVAVDITVMCWRKANAIHKWFVDTVQDGEDDCGEHDVSREQLEEMAGQCERAVKSKGDNEILPPAEGFFFGSTERDEYYYEELERTGKEIRALLANPKLEGFTFQYSSSW